MRTLLILASAIIAASCSAESPPPPVASETHQAPPGMQQDTRNQIDEILSPDILGVTLQYAESLIGTPAKYQEGRNGIQLNSYQKDDCNITLGVHNSKVVSVESNPLGHGCDVDVGHILNKSNAAVSATTFKDYGTPGNIHFTSSQIPSCNACGEGAVFALIEGTTASGGYDVQLSSSDYDFDKFFSWKNLLEENGIDGYELPDTSENCPLRSFDTQAFALLADFKVDGIAFGFKGTLHPACRGN